MTEYRQDLSDLAFERDRLLKSKSELLAVLEDVLEQIGWRGSGGDVDTYECEYCHSKHIDCRVIPHSTDCLVTRVYVAIAKAKAGAS